MKNILFAYAALLFTFVTLITNIANAQSTLAQDSIYDKADIAPKFPGKEKNWLKFILGFRYPPAALKNGISGKVVIKFVVEKDGALTNLTIEQDPGSGTGQAMIDLFRKSPNWEPGTINGQAVRARSQQTIDVKLDAQ